MVKDLQYLFLFILGITYIRYCSDLRWLALAACIIENSLAVVIAPPMFLENRKFFLAITNGLTTLLAKLLDIFIELIKSLN